MRFVGTVFLALTLLTTSLSATSVKQEQGIKSAYAFAKLYGYVRHFHPSDEGAATDWYQFAVDGMRRMETVESDAELCSTLKELFAEVAPTVSIFFEGENPETPPALRQQGKGVVYWSHVSTSQFRRTRESNALYQSRRIYREIPAGQKPPLGYDPAETYEASLGGKLKCRVPTSLYFDALGTYPHSNTPKKPRQSFKQYDANERAVRLADVTIAWNIFQHFYPYFDVVNVKWDSTLSQALHGAWKVNDPYEFLAVLRRLSARAKDGHAFVSLPENKYAWYPPIRVTVAEEEIVVTEVLDESLPIKKGDIIRTIDSIPAINKYVDRYIQTYSGSIRQRRYLTCLNLLVGEKDTKVKLGLIRRKGDNLHVTLTRDKSLRDLPESRPETLTEIRPGIIYIDISKVDNKMLQEATPRLAKATGLIYDFRGYPAGVYPENIFANLTDVPMESSLWQIPIVTKPDHTEPMSYYEQRWRTVQPAQPRFKAKAVFLIDGHTVSHGESCMHYVETYKLGEIIGEATAGTNGAVNFFTLPSGYNLGFTGMRVLKGDGSQHHSMGILPTIPVKRTIDGITRGEDEYLEKAIEILQQNN